MNKESFKILGFVKAAMQQGLKLDEAVKLANEFLPSLSQPAFVPETIPHSTSPIPLTPQDLQQPAINTNSVVGRQITKVPLSQYQIHLPNSIAGPRG
jgi:hypothetical protein